MDRGKLQQLLEEANGYTFYSTPNQSYDPKERWAALGRAVASIPNAIDRLCLEWQPWEKVNEVMGITEEGPEVQVLGDWSGEYRVLFYTAANFDSTGKPIWSWYGDEGPCYEADLPSHFLDLRVLPTPPRAEGESDA